MEVDPLASMRCWAVTVELGGREYTIPALPAVDWWPIILHASPTGLLDLLKSEGDVGEDDLDAMLLDGRISGADLAEIFVEIIEQVAGRSPQAAFAIATVASANWPVVGGQMARVRFRWDRQSIGAALDALYSILVEGFAEKSDLNKFLSVLEADTSTPASKRKPDQRVKDEFESMAGPRPAPAPVPEKATAALSGNQRPKTRPRLQPPRQVDQSAVPSRRP